MAESSSRSSVRSAASGGGPARGRRLLGMHPPLPYSEGPFEYEPAVICFCGMKAAKFTSWTEDNPGRRYYRCRGVRSSRDCGYFEWIDREHTPYERTLLLNLWKMVDSLKKENDDLHQKLQNIDEVNKMNVVLIKDLGHKSELVEEMQKKLEVQDAGSPLSKKTRAGSPCSCASCLYFFVFVVVLFALMFGAVKLG